MIPVGMHSQVAVPACVTSAAPPAITTRTRSRSSGLELACSRARLFQRSLVSAALPRCDVPREPRRAQCAHICAAAGKALH
jgi:hypothetical protein